MPDFDMPGWQDSAKAVLNKSIGDPSVKPKLVTATASHDFPLKLGSFVFSITPEAAARIVLFNSKDDLPEDPMDRVIGDKSDAEDKNDLPPQVIFDEKGAWLAHCITAGVKAEGGGDLGALGLQIEGEKAVDLCHYHFHPDRTEKVNAAVPADFRAMRFAIRRSDLTGLPEHEAVAYRVRGKLSTSVEASLADALTANLNGLSSFLRTNTPLAIEVKTGANLKFVLTLTDTFLVVFSHVSKEVLRVGVKKGKVSSFSTSAELGIQAGLANPEVLADQMNAILEGIAGSTIDKVDQVLKKNLVSELTDPEQSTFARLLQRLKLDDNVAELASVRTHWNKLKDEVHKRVTALLSTKIEAAFHYEYSQIRSQSTLLQVLIPVSGLDTEAEGTEGKSDLYSSLIKMDLEKVLQWCRDSKVEPEKYMLEKKLSINKAWGLSISLGSFKVGGKDIEKLEKVNRFNFKGDEQVTFLGQRGYEGEWFGQSVTWMTDFQAQMPGFEKAPQLSHFEYGLAFKWQWVEKELSEEEIDTYLDHARIWRATNSHSDPGKALSRFLNQNVKISLDVRIDDSVFRELIKAVDGASNRQIALALAKAMPWDKVQARSILERRTALYTPLWEAYLMEPHETYRAYAATARKVLQENEDGEAAFLEGTLATGSGQTIWQASFAETVRLNGTDASNDLSGIRNDWEHFRRAVRTLNQGIQEHASSDHLIKVFKDLCQLWANPLQLRSAGIFWVDLAATLSLLGKVERSLTVEVPKEGLQLKIGVPSA